MLVILDSNLLLSALLSPHGRPAEIYAAWQDDRFTLLTCQEQLEELRRASRYPKVRAILQPHLVGKMLNSFKRAQIIESTGKHYVADDPYDSFLLNLAAEGLADYLVTGDKRAGLLQRKRIARAAILTASQFVDTVLHG